MYPHQVPETVRTMSNPTPAQQQRAVETFAQIAGAEVEIIWRADEYTVLTTELGMYRIAEKYAVISKGHSVNLGKWYVTIRRLMI